MQKVALLVFVVICGVCQGIAQETWTLEKCINHALQENLQLKQAELNVELQQQSLKSAKGDLLPNLNGFASHTYNFGQTIDPFTNQFANSRVRSNNFYLSSQANLFNGFQTKNSIEKSEIDLSIAEQSVAKSKNDIALLIANYYLVVLFNEEALKVANEQVLTSQKQVERLEKLVQSGSIPEGDLYTLQAQLATDELSVINAENQLLLSKLNLQQTLQLDSIQDFRIAIPNIDINQTVDLSSTPGQVYNQALGVMPEIKMGEQQMASAIKSQQIANSGKYPQLQLQASVGTGYSGASKEPGAPQITTFQSGITESGEPVYSQDYAFEFTTKPFGDQVTDNLNQSVGLNLSIPIFNRFGVSTSIQQAKINQEIAQVQLAQTKNQLRNDIEKAYADAQLALKQYNASEKSLASLKQAFDYAQKRYDVGLINSVQYTDANNRYFRSKSDLLRAKYDYVFKTKILDFYQGKSLVF